MQNFFVVAQLVSLVWLFANPCTTACQASLSFTKSWSFLRLIPLIQWCYTTTSSSVTPFSSFLQSFPASGSFPMSQYVPSGGQRTEASVSILPMSIQGWFPLGLTGLISLLSKSLSSIFSNITVQKHQFFIAQFSLRSNSHINTWLLENHSLD